jgi:multicomponent Na+:H+ antiporter subunit G
MSPVEILGPAILIAGAILLAVAALGVVLLPDALARQHAATKAGTLALAMVCTGALLLVPDTDWAWRLGALLALSLATLPVASHALARGAVRELGQAGEAASARWVGPASEQREPEGG